MTIAYQSSFYVTGGTLQRDAPCYVERRADDELFEGLSLGQFCYVLTSRQMGKSSLMVRTATRLRKEGAAVAVLDLTSIGQNLTAEQWYDGLIARIGQQLDIEDEIEDFWLSHERLGPLQRWMFAIEEIVMNRFISPVVIFIDEIDAVRSLPFPTDEFFAGIRELYNRRAEAPRLRRLTFCLLGVATPSNLIQDTRTTPFNIGRRIELNDFTEREAAILARGLGRDEETGRKMLGRVLYWTGGHPYLTQRVCQSVAEDENAADASGVDRVCESLFFSSRARERDDNLLFVRERLLRSEIDLAALLDIYSKVRRNKRVRDDETNTLISVLRLSGITKTAGGNLRVRNRIYHQVFDREWIKANMPDAELQRQRAAYLKGLIRAAAIATVIIILMVLLAFTAFEQQKIAVAQKRIAEEEKVRADENAQRAQQALTRVEEEKLRADESARQAHLALVKAEEERKRADENARQARLALLKAEEERKRATENAEKVRLALQEAEKLRQLAEQREIETEQQRLQAVEQKKIAEEGQSYIAQVLYSLGEIADKDLTESEILIVQGILNRAPRSGAIAGRVYERSTSNPVSGARVTLASKSVRRQTQTRPDGSYLIRFLPKDEYTLTVEHNYYANASIVKGVFEGGVTVAERIYLRSASLPPSQQTATRETPKIIRRAGSSELGAAIRLTIPEFPQEAEQARITGSVVVEVTIDEQGNVSAARAISGHPLLRKPAEEAARQWKFAPTTISDQPVKVITALTFHFHPTAMDK